MSKITFDYFLLYDNVTHLLEHYDIYSHCWATTGKIYDGPRLDSSDQCTNCRVEGHCPTGTNKRTEAEDLVGDDW
jgi:hypothetical protein